MEHLVSEDTFKILIDLSGLEEANNERTETTYYGGGQWRVGDKVGNGYGNDRGDNHLDDVEGEVLRLCKERWTDEADAPDWDSLQDEIREVLLEGFGGDRFLMVLTNEGGGAFHVTSEETEEDAKKAEEEALKHRRETVERLAESLQGKIPYTAPGALKEKLEEFLYAAFDAGQKAMES